MTTEVPKRESPDAIENERGCALSPAERVTRIFQRLEEAEVACGVGPAEFRLTEWELTFLDGNDQSKWPNFTPKQEAVMQKIEAKVFGNPPKAVAKTFAADRRS